MDFFKQKRYHSKKDKKLIKLIKPNSGSDDEGSEHELSYYLNDRVKMMKEVLKIIKSRKIKSMAPECMKTMDIEEINSMLLEELLGISNKRLRHIFSGQILNEESSSTDPEDQPIDIISLDDISDDELIIDLDSDVESKQKPRKHKTKIKQECRRKRIKRERHDKEVEKNKKGSKSSKEDTGHISDSNTELNPISEKNLMSVLELLELQARARAIRSQLVLENCKSSQPKPTQEQVDDEYDEDAVIVESPKNEEIIITSDSETEQLENRKENGKENQQIEKHQLESDSEREKSAVSIHKVRIIQKNTVKKSQGNKDIFWKNSHRDSTSSSSVHSIQQTTIREVENNNVSDKCANGSHFPNKTNEIISDIPLPGVDVSHRINADNLQSNCLNNSNTAKLNPNDESEKEAVLSSCEKIDKDSIMENKAEAIESNTNMKSSEDTQTNPKKSNTKNEIKAEETHKADLPETSKIHMHIPKSETNVGVEETIVPSKNKHKKVCRRKAIKTHKSPKVKRVDESNMDDNESIILDVDQSEIDCINLD